VNTPFIKGGQTPLYEEQYIKFSESSKIIQRINSNGEIIVTKVQKHRMKQKNKNQQINQSINLIFGNEQFDKTNDTSNLTGQQGTRVH